MQYLSIPYKWGGQNVLGFDCSGLVLTAMKDVGIVLPDMTSQRIYEWMYKNHNTQMIPDQDCILFFGDDIKKITHVSVAIDDTYMIEAGGAGRDSLTLTDKELADRDARVRIKRIDNRKDLVACIKLKY